MVACHKNEDPGIRVTGVSLDKTSLMLTITETETLTATVTPDEATNKSVRWSSSNAEVATVSFDGTVTALKGGNATITVTTVDGDKKANCTVTVDGRSITVGEQRGEAKAGAPAITTYPITTTEISSVAKLETVIFYTGPAGTTTSFTPGNLYVGVSDGIGSGTVERIFTITAYPTAPTARIYYFRIKIDGVMSNVATFTVE